ncbi:RHS repeat protein [Pseudomonas sp. p1(2021b)]|uniref:RHS repeat-associated core domain-containing protein n=1 Tax=Pseudomonas sp. p1(2021b) TaxID=2874628 RepID=UPI001CCE6A2C|nr:RHS repeat-associated core domain-containing protein [Pseudomonas sp. p1(2021b)]UBM27366.1 RHS repeat protein [Pseudomonas sp. p1(2021b)]
MLSTVSALNKSTPTVTVVDNRGLTVRIVTYHRHPDVPQAAEQRSTWHCHDARGFLSCSADPRLAQGGRSNFTYLTDLAGTVLQTRSVDAGTSITLRDAAGRPFVEVAQVATDEGGNDDLSQAVTRTWQYEAPSQAGRPLSVTEQVADSEVRIAERFVWAQVTQQARDHNLLGQATRHYDPAGLAQANSFALTGVPISTTRQLLKDADNPDIVADWQGEEEAQWDTRLAPESYTTQTTADATGATLTTLDAVGNLQRVAYDAAGQLRGSWLTIAGKAEQVIVQSLSYSAAGQKLREVHGNGVVTTYTYEPDTQRLSSIKTERQGTGAKVLQDLRYAYDPVGNVLKIRNDAEATRFWRNQKVVPENTYSYDSLYQLASATGREMANAGQQGRHLPHVTPFDSTTYTSYMRTYRYDTAGNLLQIRHSAPATNHNYTTDVTVSDRSNRAVLSSMTKASSAVEALFTPGGQQAVLLPGQPLAWSSRAELEQVVSVKREGGTDDCESYRYDNHSQRVLKASTQRTARCTQSQRVIYLPGLELRTHTNGDTLTQDLQVMTVGEAGRAQVRVLHWQAGKPDDLANDQLRYSYDNLLGSSALEVDGAGNLISQEEYYPFGGTAVWAARNEVEASYKTVRYSGKERDATGLYYYGYRYYQPWAGRWLSADPAGALDGLNLFCMVRNNPATYLDPDGRVTIKNHSVADGALLTELFEDGHVLYGLRAPILSAVSELMSSGFRSVGGEGGQKTNIFYQGQMTDGVWDGALRPTKYSSDADIERGFNDAGRVLGFKRFLKGHPRYNVRNQSDAKRLKCTYSKDVHVGLWKRTSKAGLEFQLLVRKAPVHFLMDGLEINEIVSKQGGGGQSVTASELRWLYRRRELLDVKGNVFFYRGGKKISHAEVFGDPQWQRYIPKERSCQQGNGRRSNGVFGALRRYIRSRFQ